MTELLPLFLNVANRPVVLHSADVFVDKNALCYVTDFSAGLYIVEYKG